MAQNKSHQEWVGEYEFQDTQVAQSKALVARSQKVLWLLEVILTQGWLATTNSFLVEAPLLFIYIYIYYNIRNVEVPTPLFLMPSVTPTEAYDSDVCESYFAIHMERTVVIVDFFIECLHHKLEAHRSLQAFPKSIAAMFECPKYHQISQFCLSPKICQYTYSVFSTFPNEKWEESIGKLPCPRCGHRFLWLRCAARSPTGGESQDAQRGSGSVETGKRCGKPWFLRKMIYPLVI